MKKTVGIQAKEERLKQAITYDMQTMKQEYRKQFMSYYILLYVFLFVLAELVRMVLPATMTFLVIGLFSLLYTALASMAVKTFALELGVKYSGSERIGYFEEYDKYTIESKTRITIARWLLEKEVVKHFLIFVLSYGIWAMFATFVV